MAKLTSLPAGYSELLQELRTRIRFAQVRAALAVNRELVLLYWSIGKDILARQGTEGWGGRVIDRLAHDLQNEFPGVEGFSPRSLKYMRALAEAWPEESIVQQLIAQLPWGHNVRVLDRVKDRPTRVVPASSAGARLESECPGSRDLRAASREGREGPH